MAAEERKVQKYADLAGNYCFYPLAFETFGPWGPLTRELLSKFGRKMAATTGEKRSFEFLRQRISIEVQRGNASCILSTHPITRGLDEAYSMLWFVTRSTACQSVNTFFVCGLSYNSNYTIHVGQFKVSDMWRTSISIIRMADLLNILYSYISLVTTVTAAPVWDHEFVRGPVVAVVAVIGEQNGIGGMVTMTQELPDEDFVIEGLVINLRPGKHGFHVFGSGDMSNGCYDTGGSTHFNPFNATTHGAPTDTVRHVGDLGNSYSNENGIARFKFTDSIISLYPSTPAFVIGRMLVVHEMHDDMRRGDAAASMVILAGG